MGHDAEPTPRAFAQGCLFDAPDSLPLPAAGHHHLGVAFTDLTVMGAGDGSGKKVEDLPHAMIKMWDIFGFAKTLLNLKLGPSRPLIGEPAIPSQRATGCRPPG